MSTYTSKPVTIQAVQFTSPDAVKATFPDEPFPFNSDGTEMMVITIQGQLVKVGLGEYIVQEQDDPTRFYPVAAEVFERRYEEVVR